MKCLMLLLSLNLALMMTVVKGYNYNGRPVCGPCRLRNCPLVLYCPHGVVKDQCNCCNVCVRREGELCGNNRNIQGQCRDGLFCYSGSPVFNGYQYQQGVCQRQPISWPTITNPCPPSCFYCKANRACILNKYLCDGIQDCSDAADERYPVCTKLTTNPCPSSCFYCKADNACVLNKYLCDGIRDCSDAADEGYPVCIKPTTRRPIFTYPCPPSCFYCKADRKCIQKRFLCDGIRDCSDGEDECYPVCSTTIPSRTTLPPLPIP